MNEDILFYAFRYAIGRMTYAPSTVVMELRKNWEDISEPTRNSIKGEIKEAIRQGKAGMEMDVAEWQKILEL